MKIFIVYFGLPFESEIDSLHISMESANVRLGQLAAEYDLGKWDAWSEEKEVVDISHETFGPAKPKTPFEEKAHPDRSYDVMEPSN